MDIKCENNNGCDEELEVLESESDTNSGEYEVVVKKKKVIVDWNFVNTFNNSDEAKIAVEAEDTWSLHYRHKTEDGTKVYYRCNKLKRRGPQCSAKMYLLFEIDSDSVYMFKLDADHDHDQKIECCASYGLSEFVKTEINNLFDLKMKPKAIMKHLSEMDYIQVPKMSQLRNYLHERRRTLNMVAKRKRPSKASADDSE